MALSLKMFMLRLATALSDWYCLTKLCSSLHFAQISSTSTFYCCCSCNCFSFSMLSSFLCSSTNFFVNFQDNDFVLRHNIIDNSKIFSIKDLKDSACNTIWPQFPPGQIHGKSLATRACQWKLSNGGCFQKSLSVSSVWKDTLTYLKVLNGLLIYGLD